jgi:hypothetical protein
MGNHAVAKRKASTVSQPSIPLHTGRENGKGERMPPGKVSLTSLTFLTVD